MLDDSIDNFSNSSGNRRGNSTVTSSGKKCGESSFTGGVTAVLTAGLELG